MTGKKIGFFGGTFDPIHFGHINLALYLLENEGLDEIFVCPARYSPYKKEESSVSGEHRREMVRLAIEPLKRFTLIDLELNRPGPSYTIDTIIMLKNLFKEDQFYLILGKDTLPGLSRWKNIEKLLELAPPLIGERPSANEPLDPFVQKLIEKHLILAPIMDISSTDLRFRLRQGKFCGHLLPGKVVDYICQHHLYY